MRGRQRRAAQRRAEARRYVDEREGRVGQAEPDVDSGQGGGEELDRGRQPG
jgi:hypothetical protein